MYPFCFWKKLSHQSSGLAGDDLVKALEGLGLEEGGDGGGGGDDGNILPVMQSIMQNLLSKDVLYPSLKEITAKVSSCLHLIQQYHLQSATNKNAIHSASTPSGWMPTSQTSVRKITSATSSKPKSWGTSVGCLSRRSRALEIRKAPSRASWTWCRRYTNELCFRI